MTGIPSTFSLPETAPAGGEEFVMPCSISQERFWVLDQLAPGQSALNIPIALKLKGPLDVGALHKALDLVVQRHESLRSTFSRVGNQVSQIIQPGAHLSWHEVDLTGVSPEQRQERMQAEMRAEAVRPISLTQAPILRPTLIKLDEREHGLLLTLHHIICDGWANGVLIREMGICYQAVLEGREPALPELAIQCADYAVWQRDWVKTPDFEKQLGFWEKQLAGEWPALDFPTDYPRTCARMFPAFTETLLLPSTLTDAIKRLCRDLDCTLFMLFFTTYTALLYRYTGQTRFVIGTTAANRSRPELEHLIGQFSNPVMLPTELADGMTFRAVLARVKEMSLSVMSHQEVPFESILERLEEATPRGSKPAIQAHFLFQRAFMQPGQHGDLLIAPTPSASPGTTFDFTMGIVERGEGIRLQLEYNTALFELPTIRRLLGHFQALLQSVVRTPDLPVHELDMLSPEEQAALWSPSSPKSAPYGEISEIDAPALQEDFRKRCADHFQSGPDAAGPSVELPAGLSPVVLDRHLRLLPRGVTGHLYLRASTLKQASGDALAAGPLDSGAPVALFRTGFIARGKPDGTFELRGEAKDFVRVNGFQVNLRRVRAGLLRHPGVADAAATVSANGSSHLLGYIIPTTGATASERDLREFLKQAIGELSVPERILTVASFPRDTHGHVVTELLPDPHEEPRPSNSTDKMPPEALLYHQLLEVWREILKIPSLTIDDNFFALGGSSLLALRMMTQVEKLCGRPLPLSLLLTGATIANLARHIIDANNEGALPLIPVQTKGTKQPIFFLHGDWAGGGFYTNRLSELLGEDQPFYVLPPYRAGGQERLTLEQMAASHIKAMQEQSPHGPYVIGGYCIGATVACEMARQLTAKGEKITRLLLIDPPQSTPWYRWAWPCLDKLGDLLKWNLQRKIYYFDRYCVSFSRWSKRSLRQKLTTLLQWLGIRHPKASPLVPATGPQEPGDLEILNSFEYAVYFLAYRLYCPKPMRSRATMFFPESTMPARIARAREMSRQTPVEIEVAMLAGDHHTCITRHTPDLVEKIKATLNAK